MWDPIGEAIERAAHGRFPTADGGVEVVPTDRSGLEWVVTFTAHTFIATTLAEAQVREQGADAFGAVLQPAFLQWLAGEGGQVGSQDALLVALGAVGGSTLPARTDLEAHPRVVEARRLRADVRVFGDERGVITLGRGLGGVQEVSLEVAADAPSGAGTALIREALRLVDENAPLLAQVAPGNARSLRSFLRAGFAPIGGAVWVRPGRRQADGRSPAAVQSGQRGS